MSKQPKHLLLPAEEQGWALWQIRKDGLQRMKNIGDLEKSGPLPKETRIAFPTSSVAIKPMLVQSDDVDVRKGIARLQLEQSNMLSTDAQSWDVYTVGLETSLSAGVVLMQPEPLTPEILVDQSFDMAARFYESGDLDAILCVKEQGSWSLLFYKEAQPFYTETIDSLDSLSSYLRSILIKFSLDNIEFTPEIIRIRDENWLSSNGRLLEQDLKIPVEYEGSRSPVFNGQKELLIIPKEVLEARIKKKGGEKIKLIALVVLCLYVIGFIFVMKQHKQLDNKIEIAQQEAVELEPKWMEYQQDMMKLNELDKVLTNNWPLASFERIVSHIPGRQELRFQTVEIQNETILIKGISPNINLINKLYPQLKKEPYFKEYEWSMLAPVENQKTKLLSFRMEAIKKGGASK